MKKLIASLVLSLAFGMANAQVELWLGPKVGLNIASVSDLGGDATAGMYGGVAFAVKFSERYALQPELGFSMQGVKSENSDDLKLNYFTVGLINKLYLVDGFHVMAGPEFNFKVNDTFSDYVYLDENDEWEMYDNSIQPFDFAIVGGLGYDLPFGLSFEARFKQGLLDITDFFNFEEDSKSMLNQVFQIGIVYKFHLNK